MSRLRSRELRDGGRTPRGASLMIVLALTLVLSGCSGRSTYAPTADVRGSGYGPNRTQVALAGAPEPEMEADGLPAQRAPLRSAVARLVDPAEPFSPNYGGPSEPVRSGNDAVSEAPQAVKKPSQSGDLPVVQVNVRDLPSDLPPDFRERLIVSSGLR